jgi:pyrroloquinoline quinone (PQQ) biosynthesis protein C
MGQHFASHLLNHPFMLRCTDGTITERQLRAFLIQHGKYSVHFIRFLCAIMSQLEETSDVSRLAGNLAEELGYGSSDQVAHSSIYSGMLKQLDITIDSHPANPETQALIDTMFMLCSQPRGIAGLGALYFGAEVIVSPMYTKLLSGLRRHGIADADLKFFLIHIDCDDAHAEIMHQIMSKMSDVQPHARETMLNAGMIAFQARLRFFDALLEETEQ